MALVMFPPKVGIREPAVPVFIDPSSSLRGAKVAAAAMRLAEDMGPLPLLTRRATLCAGVATRWMWGKVTCGTVALIPLGSFLDLVEEVIALPFIITVPVKPSFLAFSILIRYFWACVRICTTVRVLTIWLIFFQDLP